MTEPLQTPDLGEDILCFDDVDEGFATVTGLDLVKQDVYHRLLQTTILAIDESTHTVVNEDFGIDVRDYLGRGLTPDDVSSIQPEIDAAIQRDERIQFSETTCTASQTQDTNEELITISIQCETALGPFSLVIGVSEAFDQGAKIL